MSIKDFGKDIKDKFIRLLDTFGIVKNNDNGCGYEKGTACTYVAAAYERDDDGNWFNCGFADNTLERVCPDNLGFVISGHSGYGIDHAPDAAHILFGLGLIPDNIEKVIAIDRRGDDFAGELLAAHIAEGATVIWDAMGSMKGILPSYYLERAGGWRNFDEPIQYTGPLNDTIVSNWWQAAWSAVADECRVQLELQQKGESIMGRISITADGEELADAVSMVSTGKLSFDPNWKNTWGETAFKSMAKRSEEIVKQYPEAAAHIIDAGMAQRCCEVWERVPKLLGDTGGRVVDFDAVVAAAEIAGINHMVDAVLSGVPVEDVVA